MQYSEFEQYFIKGVYCFFIGVLFLLNEEMEGGAITPETEESKRFEAEAVGRIEAVLKKKEAILGFKPEELQKITAILGAIRAAGNSCCTGG
jgi:hypothetical protein